MPETLKVGAEKSPKPTELGHLEVLTKEADNFNPDEAKKLAEQDRPKTAENLASKDPEPTFLMTMPEKQEKELSPEDAANEYLYLLDELSQDFSNPHYNEGYEGKRRYGYGKDITTELGQKYSDNPHYNHGYVITGVGDKTMSRVASADCILANEIGWRTMGKRVAERIEQIDKDLAGLDESYSKKSRLGRFFGKRKYEKAKKALEESRRDAASGRVTDKFNDVIAKELAYVYDAEGGAFGDNGYNSHLNWRFTPDNFPGGLKNYHGIERDAEAFRQQSKMNEQQSRRFFGLDDPERAAKVERAIELRQKYEAEWSKKK